MAQISWKRPPGSLLLALNAISHHVSGYMGSLHTGFAADMDGDGDMDILSDSGYRSLIAWFENNGTGGGWERHDVSSAGEIDPPIACYPIDIEGDGDIDVIGSERSSIFKRIYLWLNTDGTGTVWETHIIADDLISPWSICAADVERIRNNSMVPSDIPIYGYIYDCKSGSLVEVPEATEAGKAS